MRVSLVLGLLLCPTFALACSKQTIVFGWDAFPPYQIGAETDAVPRGIVVDMLQQAARQVGCDLQIRYRNIPWTRSLLELKLGRVDMLATAGKNAKTRDYAYYFRYYLQAGNAIFVNQQHYADLKSLSFAQLMQHKDFSIGYSNGYFYGDLFDAMLKRYPEQFQVAISDDVSILKAASRRVDAFAGDVLLVRQRIAGLKHSGQLPQSVEFVPLPLPLTHNPAHAYFIYSKKSMPRALAQAFDQAFYRMYQSGETERIFRRYMQPRDVRYYLVEPKP